MGQNYFPLLYKYFLFYSFYFFLHLISSDPFQLSKLTHLIDVLSTTQLADLQLIGTILVELSWDLIAMMCITFTAFRRDLKY